MSDEINDGGPAFPLKEPLTSDSEGMSLRDWVAGQCIAAAFGDGQNEALHIQDGKSVADAVRRHWAGVAGAAFVAADAMIAAREGSLKDG